MMRVQIRLNCLAGYPCDHQLDVLYQEVTHFGTTFTRAAEGKAVHYFENPLKFRRLILVHSCDCSGLERVDYCDRLNKIVQNCDIKIRSAVLPNHLRLNDQID